MTKSHQNDKIAGLEPEVYDEAASNSAKVTIFLWLGTGVIYGLATGTLVSWGTVLLFMPGIFVIALVSMPFFLLKTIKLRSSLLTAVQIVATQIIDIVLPIGLAILFLSWING